MPLHLVVFFFQAEDGIRDYKVTGVQTCALPIFIVAAVFAVLFGIGALLAPVLQTQAKELQQRIPQAIDRVDRELAAWHVNIGPLRLLFSNQFEKALPYLFPFFSTTVSAITGLILVIFLTIFFAADPFIYQRGVLHLM